MNVELERVGKKDAIFAPDKSHEFAMELRKTT
jgi:hypothetical protein